MGQFLDIAETILRAQRRPLRPKEIVELAKDQSLFSDKLAGKTPWQTMKAKLSVDVRKKGKHSRFVRTGPNTFYLRELMGDDSRLYEANRQAPGLKAEDVIAFPSEQLDTYGRFQGITRSWRPFFETLLRDHVCRPMPRLEAEQREDYKQLLTYVLVTKENQILSFRRGTFNRVEDYLRGSLCIGFGGHVAEIDRTLFNLNDYRNIIVDNASRELKEELRIPQSEKAGLARKLKILGLLNDDSSATGRKHLAVILRYEAPHSDEWARPQRGEKSITQLRWLDLTAFTQELRAFEYWSQLCLTEFFQSTVAAQPSFVVRRKTPFLRPHILCIIGGIGSGKSAATEILKQEFGYTEINSGKVVSELLGLPPVPVTNRNAFQRIAWEFISSDKGPPLLASALLAKAKGLPSPILIDGIRQRATLEELRRQAAPLRIPVVFVHTPPNVAYQFYASRESGQNVDIHEFLKLYDASVETEVKKLISMADAVLYNWTGKLKYQQVVRQLVTEIQA